ncbi:MAG: lipid II flippase Amj family protein [Firmicutes bacterium]|nr:lipid II flippase Amj family protein [Bacillota bacterium]
MYLSLLSEGRLLFVCIINAFVNILSITTGAARISGVETKRVAVSLTLYNLFAVIYRLANLFYVPVMGSIVDKAALTGNLPLLEMKMRLIIAAATVGSLIGALFLPTFIQIYIKGINGMEKRGSMVRVIFAVLNPANYGKVFATLRKPSLLGVENLKLGGVPRNFLMFNVFGIAIWTVGVLAATYASAMAPNYARTAVLLSGIINGIGTIFLFVVVDPTAALIVDQTVAGLRPPKDVKIMVLYLTLGTILGTILGQFIFSPSALFIYKVTVWLGHLKF